MKKSRFSEEQIIRVLQEAEAGAKAEEQNASLLTQMHRMSAQMEQVLSRLPAA